MPRVDREAEREYQRRYWAEHKEELTAKRNARATLEERTAYHNEWQRKHREEYNAYQREWRRKKKLEKEKKKLDKEKQK